MSMIKNTVIVSGFTNVFHTKYLSFICTQGGLKEWGEDLRYFEKLRRGALSVNQGG